MPYPHQHPAVQILKPGKKISLNALETMLITSVLEYGKYDFQVQVIDNIYSCCSFGIVPDSQLINLDHLSINPFKCFNDNCG